MGIVTRGDILVETMTWDCVGIIESVDSICRNSADTQYVIMQKIFQNLKNSKLINLYNNVSFIFKCFCGEQHNQWYEKASQKYQTIKSPDRLVKKL